MAATVATGAIAFYGISQFATMSVNKSSQLNQTIPILKKVTALGRLEPAVEVIQLSAPLDLDGDRVKGGQTVRFYQRLGFEVVRTVTLSEKLKLWTMKRELRES